MRTRPGGRQPELPLSFKAVAHLTPSSFHREANFEGPLEGEKLRAIETFVAGQKGIEEFVWL